MITIIFIVTAGRINCNLGLECMVMRAQSTTN